MQSQSKAKAKMEIQKGLTYLSNILPATSQVRQLIEEQLQDLTGDHIQTVHKTQIDSQFYSKPFICTDFNRHRRFPTSFRSPYTNNYFPQTEQHNTYPSPILRDLEEKGNIIFQQYARLYYGEDGCIANFFVLQTEEGLNVMFNLKKQYNDEDMKGVWCSTNLCEIRGDPTKSVTYKLQTSILYEIGIKFQNAQDFVNVSGSMKKNKVEAKKLMQQYEIDQFHLMIVGKLVEQTQTLLRQQMQSIFLAKSKQICFKNRYLQSRQAEQRKVKLGKQFVKLRLESTRTVQ